MQTITIFKTEKGYMAKHSDPEIQTLFGTDTLPTAFTAAAKLDDVIAQIQGLNPEVKVRGAITFGSLGS